VTRDDTDSRRPHHLVIVNWRDSKHPQAGGAEVVCHELAAAFGREGSRVTFLAAAVENQPRVEKVSSNLTIRRKGSKFTVYFWALVWLLFHRRSIDAVLDSQNGIPFFSPLAVRRRTPVIMLLHHVHQDQFAKYFSGPVATLGRWLERVPTRWIYAQRAILTVSPSTRSDARRVLGVRGEIVVAPPGWSANAPWTGTRAIRTAAPTIVCVGRLVPHKRMDLFIQALPTVLEREPELKVVVIGSGTELEALRAQAETLRVSHIVTFDDACSNELRDAIMSTAWLTVNPSQGEGWGLSVLEANAFGVPAVAFRRPGLRDSIRDGVTGWLIDDGADLAEVISRTLGQLHDPAYCHAIATNARSWADKFTWQAMADTLWRVLANEERRLELGKRDRRTRSDLATVVEMPAALLPDLWIPSFRASDRWTLEGGVLSILLQGADTASTGGVLRRSGLADDVTQSVTAIRVARNIDHLQAGLPDSDRPLRVFPVQSATSSALARPIE
jgi:glycosyltransferase involved in cell wall biosynthesis